MTNKSWKSQKNFKYDSGRLQMNKEIERHRETDSVVRGVVVSLERVTDQTWA
jgi:hypothetical protein